MKTATIWAISSAAIIGAWFLVQGLRVPPPKEITGIWGTGPNQSAKVYLSLRDDRTFDLDFESVLSTTLPVNYWIAGHWERDGRDLTLTVLRSKHLGPDPMLPRVEHVQVAGKTLIYRGYVLQAATPPS